MKKVPAKWMKSLKLLHVIAGSSWLFGAIILTIVIGIVGNMEPSTVPKQFATLIKILDYGFIIGGANIILIGSLVYSIATNWGVKKHNWIFVKWIAFAVLMAVGFGLLAPAVSSVLKSIDTGSAFDTKALSILTYFSLFQVVSLIAIFAISMFRPKLKFLNKNR